MMLDQKKTPSFFRKSRLPGILRYMSLRGVKTCLFLFFILFAIGLISAVLPFVSSSANLRLYQIGLNEGMNMFVLMICMIGVAKTDTRYLVIQGTTRWAVWLGCLWKLVLMSLVLTLGGGLLNALWGYTVLQLGSVFPDKFLYAGGQDAFLLELEWTLTRILPALANCLQYGMIYYLFGCFYRRWKVFTLCIVIGLPLLLFIFSFMPLSQYLFETVEQMQDGNTANVIVAIPQWMAIIAKITRFVVDEWPTVLLCGALTALPASYLVMAGTKQP